jgi:hypothetical protein
MSTGAKNMPLLSRRTVLIAGGVGVTAAFCATEPAVFLDKRGDAWPKTNDQNLKVRQGSALDFSNFNALNKIKDADRVVCNESGDWHKVGEPGLPLRFFIASGTWPAGLPAAPEIDEYVSQLRVRGYNMVRLHFIDMMLMNGQSRDLDFNKEQLDRLHYLLFSLSSAGIYYVSDVITSWHAGYGNVKNRWGGGREFRLDVYHNADAQQHWRDYVDALFLKVNPYTGRSLLTDPALVGLCAVNEGGLAFLCRKQAPSWLNEKFREWVLHKYDGANDLPKEWGQDAQDIALPHPGDGPSIRMRDAQLFFADVEMACIAWMNSHLKNAGFQGFLTSYNNWLSPAASSSRAALDWVDIHNYFGHPTNWVNPGSKVSQASAISNGFEMLTDLAAGRVHAKPFTVTEYGHVFWSRTRHESVLGVPAYASLQGWAGICQHANNIENRYNATGPHKEALYPFNVGYDPVARATEIASALLYRRGDVQRSVGRVRLVIDKESASLAFPYLSVLPSELKRISLVTGLSVSWINEEALVDDSGGGAFKCDLKFSPKQQNAILLRLSKYTPDKFGTVLSALRRDGCISPENRSDASSEIFVSDTGEIELRVRDKYIKVVSKHTEGVAFSAPAPISLPSFSIVQASCPATFLLSSIEDAELADAKRMLFLVVTDARNTGMRLSTDDTELLELGRLPPVVKPIRASIRFAGTGRPQVYALDGSGERRKELEIAGSPGEWLLALDTAAIGTGPSMYYEVVRE